MLCTSCLAQLRLALELRHAEEVAGPLDPVYTASAEVYLLLNRQKLVLGALEKAVERAEPTHEYILSNPIFGYLFEDRPELPPRAPHDW